MKKALLILLLFQNLAFSQSETWKFIKKTDGINIYHRKIVGSSLKDVKIETTFSCNLSTITEALLDVPAFNQWIYKVIESKVVKVQSNNQIVYHNIINMPWPSNDRDVVATNKVSQNAITKEVISEDFCFEKGLPETKDLIRIKDFYAKWSFIPTENGVKGTYIFHSDPGGDLPSAVINLFIDEGPINSIKGLKKMIKLEKYIKGNSHKIVN